MMKYLSYIAIATGFVLSGCATTSTPASTLDVAQVKTSNATTLSFASPDITNQGKLAHAQVANAFGCDGGNISPQLNWANAPTGTKSFVITAYDPDAPTGSGFWHWVVFNIPVDANHIKRNAAANPELLPTGAVQSVNDTGTAGFIGACPPTGDKAHRYIFTIYALNTTLDLNQNTTPAVLGFSLNGKVLAKSQIIGHYQR